MLRQAQHEDVFWNPSKGLVLSPSNNLILSPSKDEASDSAQTLTRMRCRRTGEDA